MQKTVSSHSSRSGFTLIELLVVITIIVMLSVAGFVSYVQAGISTRNGKRQSDIENLKAALVLYRTDQGTYPSTQGTAVPYSALQLYLSGSTPQDPKNVSPYVYSYSTTGKTFSLSATLEPSGGGAQSVYTVTNP